jgi:REP element-mobilizing transposase RayT
MRIGRDTPGNSALRLGRVSLGNQTYIVTFVTWQRLRWFENFNLARIVVRTINNTGGQATLCYVVMPDHVHWLLNLTEGKSLSKVIQNAKSLSAHRINNHIRRKGTIWQAGFHDHAIRTDESLVRLSRYIIANPIRAGLCDSVLLYPHWDAVWV